MIPEPPPGGRPVKTAFERKQEDREHDQRLYWNAIDNPEFKRAMKHISEMSDRMLQVWKIRLLLGGKS